MSLEYPLIEETDVCDGRAFTQFIMQEAAKAAAKASANRANA